MTIRAINPYEHCGLVLSNDCEDPPGYAVGGRVAGSEEEPTLHPIDDACGVCGYLACASCRSDRTTDGETLICKSCLSDLNPTSEDLE